MQKTQAITQVFAQGGWITFWGCESHSDEWFYAVGRDESFLAVLPAEGNDTELVTPVVYWVDLCDEALEEFGRHPWPRLNPQEVHPSFHERGQSAQDNGVVGRAHRRFHIGGHN